MKKSLKEKKQRWYSVWDVDWLTRDLDFLQGDNLVASSLNRPYSEKSISWISEEEDLLSPIRRPPSPYWKNPVADEEEYKWDPKIDWYLFENHIWDIVKNILYPY